MANNEKKNLWQRFVAFAEHGNNITGFIMGIIGIIVVVSGVFVFLLSHHSTPSTVITPSPTAAAFPIATFTSTQPPTPITYSTNDPGKGTGCDNNGATWLQDTSSSNTFTIACSSTGATYANSTKTQTPAEVYFRWDAYLFPDKYSISVTVSNVSHDTCTNFDTHVIKGSAYVFNICDDGSWLMEYNSHFNPLGSGKITPQSTYQVLIAVNGQTQTFSINGKMLTTKTDARDTASGSFILGVESHSQGNIVSATFSNFVYTIPPPA